MTTRIGGMVLMTTLAAAGCGMAYIAGADFDPKVEMGQPATFGWDMPDALPTGDPRLDNNPFVVERMMGAVERELAARGIHRQIGSANLLVHFHMTVRDRVAVVEADREAGYGIQFGQGTQVYHYDEGTFLVDVVNGVTSQVVWRGWARADLAGMLDDPKALTKLIDQSVAGMFERFPIPVGARPVVEPIVPEFPPDLFPPIELPPDEFPPDGTPSR